MLSESRFVGETELTYAQVKRIIDEMGAEYTGLSYNIFLKYVYLFWSFEASIRPFTNLSPPI